MKEKLKEIDKLLDNILNNLDYIDNYLKVEELKENLNNDRK